MHKSDLGTMCQQLRMQEQLIESMRKEIQQLTKQGRDLEIVNKKLINDLKQQNTSQKPLSPLKITRSVGLQVKFSPFEMTSPKRPKVPAIMPQKQVAAPAARGQRNVSNGAVSNARQVGRGY